MRGNNRRLKQEFTNDPLLVHSMFDTIQGEGPRAGQPAFFIRLGGCHLKCFFCDTEFEEGASLYSVANLIDKVMESRAGLVVLTGGEPFRQNISELVYRLISNGRKVQIETAGNLWQKDLDTRHTRDLEIIVSPKTAHVDHNIRKIAAAYKYIVGWDTELTEDDGLPNESTQTKGEHVRLARPRPGVPIYIQPREDGDPEDCKLSIARCTGLCMKYSYRLSLQQHKIIDLP